MTQLPLNALRAFDAVFRSGSFAAAADTLFVTQSAVSHQIRHLEAWLGATLFDRTGNRPRLLPHGEELARSLSRSFAEIDGACRRARGASPVRTLVIAAIPSVAVCWLIPRFADFRAAHPGIATRLVYAMHGQDVDFRDVHLAFAYARGPMLAPGLRAEAFLPGTAVPVCSPALAANLRRQAAGPSDILALGLLHDTDATGWQEWFQRAGLSVALPADVPVFQDFNLLRAGALSGQGVALCPLAMIRDDLNAGRLIQLSPLSVHEDSGYHLLTGPLAEAEMAAEARAFRDWAFDARDPA